FLANQSGSQHKESVWSKEIKVHCTSKKKGNTNENVGDTKKQNQEQSAEDTEKDNEVKESIKDQSKDKEDEKDIPDIPDENKERSEEHTSELQSRFDLVCRLLLEKKKKKQPK